MRPAVFNAAVQWFCLGLMAGVVLTSAASCSPADDYPSPSGHTLEVR